MGRLGTIFIETIGLIGLSGDPVTLKSIKTVLRVQYNNLFGIKYKIIYTAINTKIIKLCCYTPVV